LRRRNCWHKDKKRPADQLISIPQGTSDQPTQACGITIGQCHSLLSGIADNDANNPKREMPMWLGQKVQTLLRARVWQ
jgi:hypothetical protein